MTRGRLPLTRERERKQWKIEDMCPFEMARLVRGQQRADRVLGFCVFF